MRNITLRATVCAWALSISAVTTPAFAETTEYRVYMQDRDIGHLIVDQEDGKARVDYDYKQNGRGPSIKEEITLDPDGAPLDWKITGRTTFGNAVEESFARSAGELRWTDLAGPGSLKGADLPSYYVAQNGSPFDMAMLAKALLNDADRTMTIAPAGTAQLAERDRRTVTGTDGPVELVTYELSGLATTPSYITLDGNGDLVALPSPGFIILRKDLGAEPSRALQDLSEQLASDRLVQLQNQFAHRYEGPVRVRNVRVFEPDTRVMSPLRDVVFAGDRITEILPAGSAATEGETQIDGGGGSLIPGLYEMHAHLGQEDALMNVLAGVTSVRDMGNNDEVLTQLIGRIEKGEVAGPRVLRSGFIEGDSAFSSANGRLARSAEEAMDHVRWYAARGFWQAKLYNSMQPEWAPAVVAEAHRLGMRVAGHVPAFSDADAMIAAGFDEITHVNQLMLGWVLNPGEDTRTLFRFKAMQRFRDLDVRSAKVTRTLDAMVANNVAHEPTLGIHELGLTAIDGVRNPGSLDYFDNLPPTEQRQMMQALFGADTAEERALYIAAQAKIVETLTEMHRRGILLIPGTDTGGAFTLHRELELFTTLGMSNGEVLARGTLDMARYLGQDQLLGSIERGKLADFLLVPADPVKDIKAIKSVAMVVKGGVVYYPDEVYTAIGIRPFTTPPRITPAAPMPAL
ncbi:amidohydrolase family protein [Croceicoccus sp. F390]|uniref:Amidohydrolase family protein n=1 Tax=Croceicoccus esteveae TaxID=3075597 RepID=A0ABU2ZHR6_9SPHN|nr:amidohydrolase family protein [Croceicoccus sp. F390]MDT0575896.1 amidohydrolase family protein [Croceicoccus sp. F390]